jgi:hypothetical protein
MRTLMRIALATTALAIGGLLMIGVSDTAFAKTKHVVHHKKTSVPSASAPATVPGALPGTPRPSGLARDRAANPGRGNPDRTPQNATDQPF